MKTEFSVLKLSKFVSNQINFTNITYKENLKTNEPILNLELNKFNLLRIPYQYLFKMMHYSISSYVFGILLFFFPLISLNILKDKC